MERDPIQICTFFYRVSEEGSLVTFPEKYEKEEWEYCVLVSIGVLFANLSNGGSFMFGKITVL